jgi:hypothetical protein
MQNKWTSGWDGNWFYSRVPTEQLVDTRGKGSYLLNSTVTRLDHMVEAPSECGPEDTNFAAFVEVTSIIRGRDAMEEFLACGLWPLSEKFGFPVERRESPLSKVMAPVLQGNPIIGEQEPGDVFEARIVSAANVLVGNYNMTEHNTYKELWGG